MATRVLELLFHGRDTGVSATINEIRGNLSNLGRTSSDVNRRMTRETGLLQRQWQALGTTWRYAIAGLAVAKIYQAIQAYKQFNQELGYLNNTMSENASNADKMQGSLARSTDALGRQALKISTAYIQPVDDVLQSFQNIAQSIPGIRPRDIPRYGAIEAKGALVSGIDPRLLGSTALGLGTAFYGREALLNSPNRFGRIEQITSQLIRAGRRMPRTTFEELANYLPQLARGAVAGGFDLPQALAMLTLEQRAGGRVSTNTLWLRQLMIRLRNPAKQAQKVYAQAFGGLTGGPLLNELNTMSGMDVFRTLIGHALQLPGGANVARAGNAVTTMKPGETFDEVMRRQGLSGMQLQGPAMTFLQQTIGGRMQSLLAAVGIVQNLGQLNTEIEGYRKAQQDLNRQVDVMRQRMPLQEMQNAFSNATTTLINEFNPGISAVAGGLTIASNVLMNDIVPAFHRATHALQTGENAALGSVGLPRVAGGRYGAAINQALLGMVGLGVLGRGPFGRIGRGAGEILGRLPLGRLPLLRRFTGRGGNPLNALLEAEAVTSAVAGQANGTYQAPFWVVIHPLSKQFINDPKYKPNTKQSVEEKVVTEAERGAAAAGGWKAITSGLLRRAGTGTAAILGSRAGMTALRAGGPVAATAGFLALPDDLTNDLGPNSPNRFKYPYLFQAARGRIASQAIPQDRRQNFRMLQNSIIEEFRRRHLNSRQADEALHRAVQDFLNPNFSARAAQAHQQAQQVIHRNRVSQDVSKNVARQRVSPGVSQAVIQAIRAGDVAGAGLGVLVPDTYSGAVDVHLTLDPAQGLDKILKPADSVVHTSPTKFWRNNQPPPTSRGKQKSARKVR